MKARRSHSAQRAAAPLRASQQALLREVEAHREPFLHAWWAHRMWGDTRLRTTAGAPLEVLEPGWLNRGPGPDFTEARLLIDGREHWGDVEVHLDEHAWWTHGHQRDPAYDRVVLHLVLRSRGEPAATPVGESTLPVLEAASHLRPSLLALMDDPALLLRRYEALPGRCGLRAAKTEPEAVQRVVAHAAETRARAKAQRILAGAGDDNDEQLLFRQLFGYLGYRPHTGLFEDLARRFPLADLAPLLGLPREQARAEVLARWFGSAGLLATPPPTRADTTLHTEYETLQARWQALRLAPLERPPVRRPGRPWNSAERRLAGLFHHLYATGRDGWLRGWLRFLRRMDVLRDAPEFGAEAVRMLTEAFSTPADEPWRRYISFHQGDLHRPARLIGMDRTTVLMANAVLPTFLAFARRDGDVELEKVLYRLYLVLPPEGPNQRTRFMEQRLAPVVPLQRSLRTHQGLLQIHQDFCRSFYEGCDRCRFPDLIAPAGD